MTIRPIPENKDEACQMARTGHWRGQKLCDICGENVADTTHKGDPACKPCVRDLTRR
jgi:hypothetical protein